MSKARKILNCACTLFAEQGYEQATVSAIAKRAGVASGTVIYQFRSKENLLQVLVREHLNGLLTAARKAASEAESAPERLAAIIHAFFDHLRQHPTETTVVLNHHQFLRNEAGRFPLVADGFRALDGFVALLAEPLEDTSARTGAGSAWVARTHDAILAMLLGAAGLASMAERDLTALEHSTREFARFCLDNAWPARPEADSAGQSAPDTDSASGRGEPPARGTTRTQGTSTMSMVPDAYAI